MFHLSTLELLTAEVVHIDLQIWKQTGITSQLNCY